MYIYNHQNISLTFNDFTNTLKVFQFDAIKWWITFVSLKVSLYVSPEKECIIDQNKWLFGGTKSSEEEFTIPILLLFFFFFGWGWVKNNKWMSADMQQKYFANSHVPKQMLFLNLLQFQSSNFECDDCNTLQY